MTPPDRTRRSFLKASAALAGATPLLGGPVRAQPEEGGGPLLAYVGTFSSPLRDVLPTQVDLPPGNGRGIHLFRVDRATGAMTAAGVHEMGTSPSHLAVNAAGTRLYSANETDRVGEREGGHGQRLRHRPGGREAEAAQHRPLRRRRPDLRQPPPVRASSCWWPTTSAARSRCCRSSRTAGWATPPTSRPTTARSARPRRPTPRRAASPFSGHDRTHAHMIQADPSGRFVLHVDLGLDKIFVWKFDEKKGTLTAERPARRVAAARGRAAALPLPPQRPVALLRPGGGLDRRAVRLRRRDGPADRPADDLHPAARVRGEQLLLRDPGLGRRPVRVRRQPAARQHRHLRRRPGRAR